jgi:ERCC4-type nuclease
MVSIEFEPKFLPETSDRFAITFHRSKNAFNTKLTDIEGISENTANKLLKHSRSFKKIQEANIEALAEVIGKDKVEKDYLVMIWERDYLRENLYDLSLKHKILHSLDFLLYFQAFL